MLNYTIKLINQCYEEPYYHPIKTFCSTCLREIKKNQRDSVLIITWGEAVSDEFFPGKKKHYFHQEFLK